MNVDWRFDNLCGSNNNNTPILLNFQDYVHPDDHIQPTCELTPGFKPFTVLWWTLLWRLYTYLLRHVFPSPSPWSLLGRWREYVCLCFLHVLFRQLRLVSFFFYCLNNPCCIFKKNLRLTDRHNVLLFGLVNVQISRTAMNGGKHSGDPVFSSYVTSLYLLIGNERPMQGKWSCLCIMLVILPENGKTGIEWT